MCAVFQSLEQNLSFLTPDHLIQPHHKCLLNSRWRQFSHFSIGQLFIDHLEQALRIQPRVNKTDEAMALITFYFIGRVRQFNNFR